MATKSSGGSYGTRMLPQRSTYSASTVSSRNSGSTRTTKNAPLRMRELAQMKPSRSAPVSRLSGRPNYKSQEEQFEEIMDLKKKLGSVKDQNQSMKVKFRKLEDELSRKDKQIDQLMDPMKNDDIRRTMADKGASLATSLKQKVVKLERALKEKEGEIKKLQSDTKTTKLHELKVLAETYYQEVLRLKNQLNKLKQEAVGSSHGSPSKFAVSRGINVTNIPSSGYMTPNKELSSKMKSMAEQVKNLTEENKELKVENQHLRDDLERMLGVDASSKSQYEELSKMHLISMVISLEKQLDQARKTYIASKQRLSEGRLLQDESYHSLELRFSEMKERENELTEERDQYRELVKRLKEDRLHYKEITDKKEKEMKSLKEEVKELNEELLRLHEVEKQKHGKPTSSSHTSPSKFSQSPVAGGSTSSTDTDSPKRTVKCRDSKVPLALQASKPSAKSTRKSTKEVTQAKDTRDVRKNNSQTSSPTKSSTSSLKSSVGSPTKSPSTTVKPKASNKSSVGSPNKCNKLTQSADAVKVGSPVNSSLPVSSQRKSVSQLTPSRRNTSESPPKSSVSSSPPCSVRESQVHSTKTVVSDNVKMNVSDSINGRFVGQIKEFRENLAAKKIQRTWKIYHEEVKSEQELNSAVSSEKEVNSAKSVEQKEPGALEQEMRPTRTLNQEVMPVGLTKQEVKPVVSIEQEMKHVSSVGWEVKPVESTKQKVKSVVVAEEEEQLLAEKAQCLRQNCAARVIQDGWREYIIRKHFHQKLDEESVTLIQSAIRGHTTRSHYLNISKSSPTLTRRAMANKASQEEYSEDSQLDSAVEAIQSALRGHIVRKKSLEMSLSGKQSSSDDDADIVC